MKLKSPFLLKIIKIPEGAIRVPPNFQVNWIGIVRDARNYPPPAESCGIIDVALV